MENEASALDFLPEALVDEMLTKSDSIVHEIRLQLVKISEIKKTARTLLEDIGLLRNIDEFKSPKKSPTTVGIDGTYCIIKQLSLDTVAIAAVGVEGLTPKAERPWDGPKHLLQIFPVNHYTNTASLCRSIMFSYELELACEAKHEVVFLDGSLVTYLIGIGQGLYAANQANGSETAPEELVKHISDRLEDTLQNYLKILSNSKISTSYAGVPKYSSRNEIIEYILKFFPKYTFLKKFNDKGLLSLVLKPGDVVGPVKISGRGGYERSLSGLPDSYDYFIKEIVEFLNDTYVLYFKPSSSHPALRIEFTGEIARNSNRLSSILKALCDQASIPGVIEPYPVHIADMFVKNVHGSLNQIKNAALSDIGLIPGLDFSDIYMFLHKYRSEGGFG